MNLPSTILGSTAVGKLTAIEHDAVIEIGSDHLTRGELAAVGCYNFLAARRLGHILTHVLQVPNLRFIYEQVAPLSLAVPKLGVISLAVLGACFEAKRIGGAAPLESYVESHRGPGTRMVSFPTIKQREAAEAAREAKEARRRKAARRNQAHQLRVTRFEGRQAG